MPDLCQKLIKVNNMDEQKQLANKFKRSTVTDGLFGGHNCLSQTSLWSQVAVPENRDYSKCPVCDSDLVMTQSEWENPVFKTLVFGFDPKVDRKMQETLYKAFPETW